MDIKRIAQLAGLMEGGNYTSFDTQAHPEESSEMQQAEEMDKYNAVKNETCDDILNVLVKAAEKHGWKQEDIWGIVSDQLTQYFNHIKRIKQHGE